MQDLANSIEQALRFRITEGALDVNVYTGADDEIKKHPSIVIYAESGNESPLGSGNFYVTVNCEFRMQAVDGGLPGFRSLSHSVFGVLMVDALPSTLSAEQSNLHVFGIREREFSTSIDESAWLATLRLVVYCCLTDLA